MMTEIPNTCSIGVIGAGTMGAGIAQVAAAAGHKVLLFDVASGAAASGLERTAKELATLVKRGKMEQKRAEEIIGRITIAEKLEDLAPAALTVEAIVERLDVKQKVFAQLEAILAEDAILATNTSSISITAIGAALKRPERLVGMHFFNPAPIMKLVEVVSGLATSPEVAQITHATARAWGKTAVHVKSTPGFIVNRVARAFYGEPLRLAEEGMADIATLDALMREGGGFRMGAFQLMDLIGNDINYAVSTSVFEAYHYEPRFRPSLMQRELVDAGRFGRKTGHGFYSYAGDGPDVTPATLARSATSSWAPLDLGGEQWRQDVLIALTDGRTAMQRAQEEGRPAIILDLCAEAPEKGRVGFATSPDVPNGVRAALVATLAGQGYSATELPDRPGLVVMRTLALIANEAFEAVLQGVADEESIDLAMRFGVNYPRGPIEWARDIGLARILAVLDQLMTMTGDMRYRASFALRKAVMEEGWDREVSAA
ncbi:3-hydroxyacyl-CoA dehydrogenase NAD-binding domain-containing protein [Chelativorans multitrophicus]|uniref:3-hydroxyacyl-CoA dehydrogenase n=2 Tax=Chelativorans TaxID=449972 RepID=Q11E57_CHESB|nr:3-hydroxyacyl-CoA dehydrogenase NAD-binding domain-containing protein [Chelativorans multitrophicus]